jgi:predicted glycoside hydrolase/deacetylase ChbG (UPF0249 family)
VLNPEQPCALEFYARAVAALDRDGCDLVRASRRAPGSEFRFPVRLLPIVHGRYRLGALFNRWLRGTLPVPVGDTQSGCYALTRRLAEQAFAVQCTSGFLFDVELSLAAAGHELREVELACEFAFEREKSGGRVLSEIATIRRELPRIRARWRMGCYRPLVAPRAITADDWGISPAVNRGILELARAGVVRRVSMMPTCPFLTVGLDELLRIPGVECGLHLNLTHGYGMSSAQWLLRMALPLPGRERLRARAREELDAQLSELERAGVPVSHVDGHRHVHLTPGVVDAIAPGIRAHGIRRVRLPYDPGLWLSTKAPVNLLSLLARRRIERLGFEALPCIYPQRRHFLDHGLLRRELVQNPGAEVIVHPAERDDFAEHGVEDPYTEGRVTEFRALRMLVYISRAS